MQTHSAKRLAGALLVVIAVGAAAVGLRRQARQDSLAAGPNGEAASAMEAPGAALQDEPVTVFYFHGDSRCETCLAIESETARVLQERFADELASDQLRFESVNFDAAANAHYRQDYDLAFGSVVVQGTGAERPWKNLADVWALIHEEPATFEAYIVEHVRHLLESAG